jgi:sulfite exporter TauE/SafE
MTDLLPTLAAAFATGLLGSAHCLGMCAGVSGLFAAGASVAAVKTQLPLAIAYNIGRISSYAILGLIVALIGSTAVAAIPKLAGPVRIAAGAMIIVIGLQVAFGWRLLSPIEKIGSLIWNYLAPGARRLIPANSPAKAVGLGMFWGWLPCGLVYSVLLLAATTAAPVDGSLIMIAFGLGTMPAMLMSGLGAAKLAAFMGRNRLGAGLLIVILGLATLALPAIGTSDHDKHSRQSSAL